MANRFVFGAFVVNGLFLLTACTTVQTASERQTYFENASTARLAWQPTSNVPTSFQGCSWDSESYPCQPYRKLHMSQQEPRTSLKLSSSATTSHKKVSHKKKANHPKSLPLCQPVPDVNVQVKSGDNNIVLPNKTST